MINTDLDGGVIKQRSGLGGILNRCKGGQFVLHAKALPGNPYEHLVHPIAAADEGSLDHGILTFLLLPIPHPDSRAAAVLVDQLDAGIFKGPSNHLNRGPARLTCPTFKLVDSNGTDA